MKKWGANRKPVRCGHCGRVVMVKDIPLMSQCPRCDTDFCKDCWGVHHPNPLKPCIACRIWLTGLVNRDALLIKFSGPTGPVEEHKSPVWGRFVGWVNGDKQTATCLLEAHTGRGGIQVPTECLMRPLISVLDVNLKRVAKGWAAQTQHATGTQIDWIRGEGVTSNEAITTWLKGWQGWQGTNPKRIATAFRVVFKLYDETSRSGPVDMIVKTHEDLDTILT